MATVAEHFGDENWFESREDSEATRIFRAMEDTAEGVTLTYSDLDRVLNRDFVTNRAPWFAALKRWHRERPNSGTWVNVQRIGYQRTATWSEALGAGKAHEKRMRSQARKSKARYGAADPSTMSPEERREQGDMLVRIGRLETAMRTTRKDITTLKRVKADKDEVELLRDQVAALTQAVTKLTEP